MKSRGTTKATWSRSSISEPGTPSAKKNIALTGFMAVGKSAVGRKLAGRLKRPFVDLDRAIETEEGMKVAEIFKRKGEAYFRAVEKRVLRAVLERDEQVIATGGGAVTDPENLELLKERSLLICLTAPPEILLRRSGGGRERPLLADGDRKELIGELLRARGASYAQAHLTLDTSRLSVGRVVDEILSVLK